MKFYISKFENIIEKIAKSEIKGILIYGPDKGYINKIIDIIEKKFTMWRTTISYQDLNNNGLDIILNAQNFLNKRELIKILNVTDSLSAEVKTMLSKEFFHFPIFIADDLKISSSIRKFFEDSSAFAAVACYYDEQSTVKFILNKINKSNKIIDEEAKNYLLANITKDLETINIELNKILYFVDDRPNITLNDIQKVLSASLTFSLDELFINFAQKKLFEFLHELNGLLENGTNQIFIIRTLLRYYINLYIVLTQVNQGINIDISIKNLSPSIFFKYINNFKSIVHHSNLVEVVNILEVLQHAEISLKNNPKNFDFYHHLFILSFPNFKK